MKKLVISIVLIFNIFAAVLLLLSYLSVVVSPRTFWILAFTGMAYPVIMLVNMAFVLFWLVFRKWYLMLSLICILAGWGFMRRYMQLRLNRPAVKSNQESLKILTYNVRLFNYYQWNADTTAQKQIISYILKEKPDVVCFQEFVSIPGGMADLQHLKKQLSYLSYSHVDYTDAVSGKMNFGMATFSRLPIVRKSTIDFEESLNGSICTDIVFLNDTIRIYNCHLQSIRLKASYAELLDTLSFNISEQQLSEIKDMSVRMRDAFIMRARQVEQLSLHIESSPYPAIVCGDFNDTPVSYAYQRLSGNMKDAFVEAGSGLGYTYRGLFPYVRIDYILCDKIFEPQYFRCDRLEWSDHFPVVAELAFSQKAD